MIVLFLMDDSGSMYGSWGDASGVRYAAAVSFLKLLGRYRPKADHTKPARQCRAGVIHWGTIAPDHLTQQPVDIRKGDAGSLPAASRRKCRATSTVSSSSRRYLPM